MKCFESDRWTHANPGMPFHFKQPLSDHDILALQDKFLTTGFHSIKISHMKEGRECINLFLRSMNCFHAIACLTNNHDKDGVIDFFDIKQELMLGTYHTAEFDDFFINDFYFDFLWIEKSDQLMKHPWYHSFEQQLRAYNIDKQIPIFILQTLY